MYFTRNKNKNLQCYEQLLDWPVKKERKQDTASLLLKIIYTKNELIVQYVFFFFFRIIFSLALPWPLITQVVSASSSPSWVHQVIFLNSSNLLAFSSSLTTIPNLAESCIFMVLFCSCRSFLEISKMKGKISTCSCIGVDTSYFHTGIETIINFGKIYTILCMCAVSLSLSRIARRWLAPQLAVADLRDTDIGRKNIYRKRLL